MKQLFGVETIVEIPSLPAWGVWIETANSAATSATNASLPAWGVWIETNVCNVNSNGNAKSLPAWGVWIETS